MNITWNDGYNTPYAGVVNISPESGNLKQTITASVSEVNDFLDREAKVTVEVSANLKQEVTIKNTGKANATVLSDGTSLMTADGVTFNVLKA